eukprot:g13678.t1
MLLGFQCSFEAFRRVYRGLAEAGAGGGSSDSDAPKGSAPHGLQAPESNTIEAVMPSEQMLKAMQRLQDQATKMAQTRSTEENAASTATDETSPKATNAPHPHATADATHEPAHVTHAPAHVTHAPAVAKHAEHSEPAKHKHNSTIGTNSTNGTNTSDSEDSTPCHSALPGEPCYEAVLWHKWVGVVENPSWYKTISRQSNRHDIQKTWMAILTDDKWWHYDFIAKVDPDAILYAERLRGHLQWHVGQQLGFRKLWSRYVFSKAALGAYLSQHERCEHSLPFWSWGEDRYMAGCLEMLGVQTLPDYMNFLHDERCWGVDCGNKAAVAFHSFKQSGSQADVAGQVALAQGPPAMPQPGANFRSWVEAWNGSFNWSICPEQEAGCLMRLCKN